MGMPQEDWRYLVRPALASACLWLVILAGLVVAALLRGCWG